MPSLKTILAIHTVVHLLLHLRQAVNYVVIGHIYMSAALYPIDMLVHYLVYLFPSFYLIREKKGHALSANICLFLVTSVLYLLLCYLGLDMVADYKTENGYYPLSYFITTLIHAHVLALFVDRIWVFIAYFGVAYSYMIFWTDILGVSYAIFMEPNHIIELLVATSFSYVLYSEYRSNKKPAHFD